MLCADVAKEGRFGDYTHKEVNSYICVSYRLHFSDELNADRSSRGNSQNLYSKK